MTPSFLLYPPELDTTPLNVTCFANMLSARSTERFFYNSRDVEWFQRGIHRAYQNFTPKMDSCPPQKTVVLYRSGIGAGLRKILNYNEVEKARQDNGIKDLLEGS